MLFNKSIKKLILVSLIVAIPAQTMSMSWLSFSSLKRSASNFFLNMKEMFEQNKTMITVAVGSCVAICLSKIYFNRKKEEIKIARERVAAKRIDEERKNEARYREERRIVERAQIEKEKAREIERKEALRGRQLEEAVAAEKAKKIKKEEFEKMIAEKNALQDRIQEQRKRRKIIREKKAAARNTGASSLAESFCELSRNETKIVTSPLTRSYIQALYYPNASLEKIIAQVNSYTPDEREKLAKRMSHEIDAETADEIRAFEFIEHGYANLAHILNNNIDAVSGYNRVARMSDEECTEFQSAAKAQEKEEIRQDYLRSIISVVWALYDCALRTGDAFTQGAFHMQNKKLQDFFLHYIIFVNKDHRQLGLLGGNCNHPHAYQRISSHLSALSKEKEIFQYGIDIRFGENGASRNFLPNKMTHILFIPYDPEHNKFILKPEDDCMYNVKEIAWHGVGLVRSKLEGLVGSADSENHQRKERIPKKVIQKFDQLITSSGIAREQQEQYKKEIRSWGIQRIVSLENEFAAGSAMYQYINELKQYKHYTMRFGQEVIFSEEELKELISLWEKAEIE